MLADEHVSSDLNASASSITNDAPSQARRQQSPPFEHANCNLAPQELTPSVYEGFRQTTGEAELNDDNDDAFSFCDGPSSPPTKESPHALLVRLTWLEELDEGAGWLIKHIIINQDFEVKKSVRPIEDKDPGKQSSEAIHSRQCCQYGLHCHDPCKHALPVMDMDLKHVKTRSIHTGTINWAISWVWTCDLLDQAPRIEAMVEVVQDTAIDTAAGMGKEVIKKLVRAACDVTVKSVTSVTTQDGVEHVETIEEEIWPKPAPPSNSKSWLRQRIRDYPNVI
ncbi:MAG: hypothetical protein Q9169_005106 [Polycauliona sp. 2 TL-2023]